MSPIVLAREMRRRGWSYRRPRRGEAMFGIGFPNGRGVTRVIPVQDLQLADLMSPVALADYFTREAAFAAGQDLREGVGG